jgi:hypothetical protein
MIFTFCLKISSVKCGEVRGDMYTNYVAIFNWNNWQMYTEFFILPNYCFWGIERYPYLYSTKIVD